MKPAHSDKLLSSTNWIMLLGISSGLVSAQWKQEALPDVALVVVLALTVLKTRLVILDFMGLRGHRPRLAAALAVWPVLFAVVILAKALLPSLMAS